VLIGTQLQYAYYTSIRRTHYNIVLCIIYNYKKVHITILHTPIIKYNIVYIIIDTWQSWRVVRERSERDFGHIATGCKKCMLFIIADANDIRPRGVFQLIYYYSAVFGFAFEKSSNVTRADSKLYNIIQYTVCLYHYIR